MDAWPGRASFFWGGGRCGGVLGRDLDIWMIVEISRFLNISCELSQGLMFFSGIFLLPAVRVCMLLGCHVTMPWFYLT